MDDGPQNPPHTALHVALLIDRWDPQRGGAERALGMLSQHLVSRGHRVTAFGAEGTSTAGAEFKRVLAGGLTRAGRERALGRGMLAAAREAGCHVTVGVRHLEEVDLYWPHAGSHLEALAARRRSRGNFRDAPPHGRHRAFVEFERALFEGRGARRIVCVSERVREEFERAWPGCDDRMVVIENGVDLERFRPELRAKCADRLRARVRVGEDVPLIAFAAHDPELKGLPSLLAALASVTRPWHLVIAGTPHPKRWRTAAAFLGFGPERISTFDYLPAEELLAGADLCCVPTWRDTSLLVLIEALACGTPVITTTCAGDSDLARAPEAGTVIEGPDDIDELAAAVTDWLGRIEAGTVDPSAVRARVEHRDQATWMSRLEREVLALAR